MFFQSRLINNYTLFYSLIQEIIQVLSASEAGCCFWGKELIFLHKKSPKILGSFIRYVIII